MIIEYKMWHCNKYEISMYNNTYNIAPQRFRFEIMKTVVLNASNAHLLQMNTL